MSNKEQFDDEPRKFFEWLAKNVTPEEFTHLMFSSDPKLKRKIKSDIKRRIKNK